MSLIVAWSSILRVVKIAGIISTGSAGTIMLVLCTISSLAELVILNAVIRMRAKLYSFRVFAVNCVLDKIPSKQLPFHRTLDGAQAVCSEEWFSL